MIQIINENFNESEKDIESLYDKQYTKINERVDLVIDKLVDSLNKLRNNLTISYLKDELGDWYFDNHNSLEIPDESDDESIMERTELIKSLKRIENRSDDTIDDDLNYMIMAIFKE